MKKRYGPLLALLLSAVMWLLLFFAANMYGTRNARADVTYRPPLAAVDYAQQWWARQPDWRKRAMCDDYKVKADRQRLRRAVVSGSLMWHGDRHVWRAMRHNILDNC
jgi:hypothetical protein